MGITLRRTRVRPTGERVAFERGQRTVIREFPAAWVGEPRRHLARHNSRPNRFGPGAHLRVGYERHRCGFTGPMALLAVGLKDGQNVAVKGRGRVRDKCKPD